MRKRWRKAATSGDKQDAIALYRKLLRNNHIPDELAAEYYPLYLATLDKASPEVADTLAELGAFAKTRPQDYPLQLAYAQVLVIGESTRGDGIDLLHSLSHIPLVAGRAKQAWREALLWQGPDFRPQAQLETYLQENPSDPELLAKRKEYAEALPSEGKRASLRGLQALNENRLAEAEKEFQFAVGLDANDALSSAMIGVIHQRLAKPDWKQWFDKAIQITPERKPEFEAMAGLDPATVARTTAEGARVAQQKWAEANRLAAAGDDAQAESLTRTLLSNKRTAGGLLLLSNIEMHAGKSAQAVADLQQALRFEPNNANLNRAMCADLFALAQPAQASGYCDIASRQFEADKDSAGLAAVQRVRASQMRAEAEAIEAPLPREAKLRDVLSLDPANVWTRLALAKTQWQLGRTDWANQTIAPVLQVAFGRLRDPAVDSVEAKRATFFWTQARGDLRSAATLAQDVPVELRDDQMRVLLAVNTFRRASLTDGNTAPLRLRALFTRPDPDGSFANLVGDMLLADPSGEALRVALASLLQHTQPASVKQKLVYAALFLRPKMLDEAYGLLNSIKTRQLADADRRRFDTTAASLVDLLLAAHRVDDADRLIRPRLASRPDSQTLQLSAAQIDMAQGHPEKGLPLLLAMLARDKGNLDARLKIIDAKMQLSQYREAEDIAQEGMLYFPRNPDLLMHAANAALALGEKAEALDMMLKARALLKDNQPRG